MKQAELDRAVARATGETVSTIKRLGFLLADPIDSSDLDADEPGPYVIDWDDLAARVTKKARGGPDMNRPLRDQLWDEPTNPSRYEDPSRQRQLRGGQQRGRRATRANKHRRRKERQRRRLQEAM